MKNSRYTDQDSLKARCGRSRRLISPQDQSDRSSQPVRPVDPEPEQKAEEVVSTSTPGALEVLAAPSTAEDEGLVDYEASPERTSMEINIVHFSDDYWAIPEEETTHLDFGPCEAIFQKPKDSDNHLKALYMRGHINGKPVSRT